MVAGGTGSTNHRVKGQIRPNWERSNYSYATIGLTSLIISKKHYHSQFPQQNFKEMVLLMDWEVGCLRGKSDCPNFSTSPNLTAILYSSCAGFEPPSL